MSKTAPKPASPHEAPDLGPLTVAQAGDRWRFTLTSPTEMTLELPPDYDRCLSQNLRTLLDSPGEPHVVMDLQNLPAISSRQLGLMLALQKALRTRRDKLPITGISPAVRRLLSLTRTEQFFELG